MVCCWGVACCRKHSLQGCTAVFAAHARCPPIAQLPSGPSPPELAVAGRGRPASHTECICRHPQRREALGLDPEGGDPDLEGLPDNVELEEAEPAELQAARDRLAAFTAARQAEAEGAEEAPPGALRGAGWQHMWSGAVNCRWGRQTKGFSSALCTPLSLSAGLVDADVEAVLEESRASQAALLADAAQQAQQAAPPAENSCPNSSRVAEEAVVPPAVPAARQTVVVGASCVNGDTGAAAAAAAGADERREDAVAQAGGPTADAPEEEGSAAPRSADSGEAGGSEGELSVASEASDSDDEPDSLEDLD